MVCRVYTHVLWYEMQSSGQKIIYINIHKPENNLITPDDIYIRRRNSRLWRSGYVPRKNNHVVHATFYIVNRRCTYLPLAVVTDR